MNYRERSDAAGDVVVAGWTRGSFDGIAPAGDLDLFCLKTT